MKRFLTRLSKNIFVQGSFIMTFASFVIGFLNYIFNSLTARALGPTGYGDLAGFVSYTTILSIPLGIIGSMLVLRIGKAEDKNGYTKSLLIWFNALIFKKWYVFAILLLITPLMPKITNLSTWFAYLILPMLFLSLLSTIYDGMMQGLHLFLIFSILNIVSTLLKLGGALTVFFWKNNAIYIILFLLLSGIVKLVLGRYIFKNKHKKLTNSNLIFKSPNLLTIWKNKMFLLTTLSTSSIALISNIDMMYVKKVFSSEDAGFYGAWSLLAKLILYIVGPLLAVAFIFFSNQKEKLRHQVVMIMMFIGLIIIGFMADFGYGLYGRKIIELIFGRKYYPIYPYMEYAAIFGILYVLIIFMNNYYLAKQSKMTLVLPILIPIYILLLFIYPKSIGDVMALNIFFSFGIVSIYLVSYFRYKFLSLFYN